jgi:uncharacterized membrane protein YqhA
MQETDSGSKHEPKTHAPRALQQLELLVERVILASRWLLVVFYVGLATALAVYAVSFGLKLLKIASAC